MSDLRDFLTSHKREVEECYSLGIDWLVHSQIRNASGGYKSEYDPTRKMYTTWGGGEDCILNTAGAIMTLIHESKFRDLALESAEYLQASINKPQRSFAGGLASGRGSNTVFPNYLGWVILALCETYGETNDVRLLESARTIADWIVEHSQLADGRIRDSLPVNEGGWFTKLRQSTNGSFSTWNAILFTALRQIGSLLDEEERYANFDGKLQGWLERAQRQDGSIPSQLWGGSSVVFQALNHGRFHLLRDHWDKKLHPTSAVLCLQVFRSTKQRKRELAVREWLRKAIGEGGLFYQFYWNGQHSIEEDVMPTALFAKLLLNDADANFDDIIVRVIRAITKSQIRSQDHNAHGGIKGLPMHHSLGDSVFSWDTQFSMMLIQSAFQTSN